MSLYINCGFKFCLLYIGIPVIKHLQTMSYISNCPPPPMEKWLLSSSITIKVGAVEADLGP